MDMMNSIAALASGMQSAQFATQYSVSVQKMAMNSEELALQEMTEMLPPSPGDLGAVVDTCA